MATAPVFSFEADFSEVTAFNNIRAPKGVYRVRYVVGSAKMLERNEKSGCSSVQLDFEVTEGEFAGATIREFIRLPDSNLSDTEKREKANKNSLGIMKAILLSMGIPEEKLKKVRVSEGSLVGKVGHLDYTPKDEGMGIEYDQRTWLLPSQYEVRLAAAAVAQDVDTSGVEVERAPARGKVVRRQGAKNVEAADDIKPVEVATSADEPSNSPDEFIGSL